MKRAGDYLAAIIDVDILKKARTYSGFFSSWAQICQNCGIAAAAGHTRIRDLQKGILIAEADHPGWIQVLQTKAQWILSCAQRRFPELDIRGISLTLSKIENPAGPGERDGAEGRENGTAPGQEGRPVPASRSAPGQAPGEDAPQRAGQGEARQGGARPRTDAWERIEDKGFKDSLKRLEQSIKEREKSGPGTAGGKK
jgi:hypothetical protein